MPQDFVKRPPLQFALRHVRAVFSDRRRWIGMALAVAILSLSGPFGTLATLSAPARLGYWAVVVVVTYAAGVLSMGLAEARLPPGPLRRMAGALCTGVLVVLCMIALNLVLLGSPPTAEPGALPLIFLAAVLIAVALDWLSAGPAPATDAPASPPRLLNRLDPDKRGALVSLSVQDHYVEVTTTRGRDLLLLRLTDAIEETAPEPGLRIHRSHWVATAQVARVRREGDRGVLTLRDGRELPVSRARLPELRAAGLMP